MNTQMYHNPVTQRNIAILEQLGYQEIPPKSALLACGDVGKGALADLEFIVKTIEERMNA